MCVKKCVIIYLIYQLSVATYICHLKLTITETQPVYQNSAWHQDPIFVLPLFFGHSIILHQVAAACVIHAFQLRYHGFCLRWGFVRPVNLPRRQSRQSCSQNKSSNSFQCWSPPLTGQIRCRDALCSQNHPPYLCHRLADR